MMQISLMILAIALSFLAAILNLATRSRFDRAFTRFALLLTGAIGTALYGYGYVYTMGVMPQAFFRALLSVCRMFAGVNDLSAIESAPWFRSPVVMTLFWMAHFLGFYVTASATISALGERLLRQIRVMMLRRGPLLLIFGTQANAIQYGKDAARQKHRGILFVDPDDNGAEAAVKGFGAVVDSSEHAVHPDAGFLRRIGMKPGKRQLEMALLHPDGRKNWQYALEMKAVLAEAGISPDQTSLIASGIGEEGMSLQASGGEGYGSVYTFDEHELAARVAMRYFPPCDSLTFTEEGRAAENYHAVIVGFGRMGRAVLSRLIMNGQFEGSSFRTDVFDTFPQNGILLDHPMTKAYDVRFHSAGGHSEEFYAFLRENAANIRDILLCTGTAAENAEMADDLAGWFHDAVNRPRIIQISREAVAALDTNGQEALEKNLYRTDLLDPRRMDSLAMQIHYVWARGKNPEEAWKTCDAFSRASCRAATDFYPAVLRAAHRTEEEVLGGMWPPEGELLENLSRTEHLRWCAFHYAMGYRSMDARTWQEQAEAYRRGEKTALGKNRKSKLHACLIPWEELDALSRRENEVTGGQVDYKEMDRENVRAMAKVLASERGERLGSQSI